MQDFKYYNPSDIKNAYKKLADSKSESIIYAGGTDILGLIKNYIISPDTVVNIKNLENFNFISHSDSAGLRIGAATKVADIAANPVIKEKFTCLAEAAKAVASPQLRNMGTIGGNLCQRPRCWYFRGEFNCLRKNGDICYAYDGENKFHCITGGGPCYIVHPSDIAVALTALDAELVIFNGKSDRNVKISDFFILPETDYLKENILEKGEIIKEIFVPSPPKGTKSTYIKAMERDVWDFAVVSVAAVISKSGDKAENGKIAFGGIAPVPWQDKILNAGLKDLAADENEFSKLTDKILPDADPLEKNGYKVVLSKNLVKKSLRKILLNNG